MKISNQKIAVLFASLLMLFVTTSCEDDEDTTDPNAFPAKMTIDIPASISAASTTKSLKAGEAFDGNEIYKGLRVYVAIAKGGAEILDVFMDAIRDYGLNKPTDITFADNDDNNRMKHLVVKENQTYEGVAYKFGLTITDVLLEGEADGGIGLQIFWSGNPITGVAIIKSKNLNQSKNDMDSAMIKIEYSEATTTGYDATMIVSISDMTLKDITVDEFSCDKIKLFVGKKGDIIDMYGNSSHPNATIAESTNADSIGINYAFVASGNQPNDYAVAEVGLPLSSIDSHDRQVILKDNSIKKVFIRALAVQYPTVTVEQIETYINENNLMANAVPPGYFANGAFVQAETAPAGTEAQYEVLTTRMDLLTPYNPTDIGNLTVSFGAN